MPSIAHWSDLEVLGLYERNWRFRGVIAEVSEGDARVIRELALKHHSWLINEV